MQWEQSPFLGSPDIHDLQIPRGLLVYLKVKFTLNIYFLFPTNHGTYATSLYQIHITRAILAKTQCYSSCSKTKDFKITPLTFVTKRVAAAWYHDSVSEQVTAETADQFIWYVRFRCSGCVSRRVCSTSALGSQICFTEIKDLNNILKRSRVILGSG